MFSTGNAALDPAVSRFTVRQRDNEEEAEERRGKVQAAMLGRQTDDLAAQVRIFEATPIDMNEVGIVFMATSSQLENANPESKRSTI
jgi:hypothetical protein